MRSASVRRLLDVERMKLIVFVFAFPVVAVAEPAPASFLVEGVAQSGTFADSSTGFGARASYLSAGAIGTQLSVQTLAGHGTLMDGVCAASCESTPTTATSFLFTGGIHAGLSRARLRLWTSLEAGVGRARLSTRDQATPVTDGIFVLTPAISASYAVGRRLSIVGEARALWRVEERAHAPVPALNLGAQLAL